MFRCLYRSVEAMTTNVQDRLLLGLSFVAAAISSVGFGFRAYRSEPARRVAPAGIKLSGAGYAVTEFRIQEPKPRTWEAPLPQRDGKDWVYEVFTPPEIFYNAVAKQFTVSPPVASRPPAVAATAGDDSAAFGLVLLSVKRAPFRLQLVGYAGDAGEYAGIFENIATGETLLARRGRHLSALELKIEAFDVRRTAVSVVDSMTTFQPVACAMVRDERTGTSVILTNSVRCYTDSMIATVAKIGDPAAPREVREGDTVLVDHSLYRIGRIQIAPPMIELERANGDADDEEKPGRRTLTVFPLEPAKNPPPGA